jgi:hypothetical protein
MTLQGTWKIRYTVDGVLKTKNSYTKDVDEAIKIRDGLFAELLAQGATEKLVGRANPKTKYPARPPTEDIYIHRRRPYIVKVMQKYLGLFDTLEEARAARDKYMAQVARKAALANTTTV